MKKFGLVDLIVLLVILAILPLIAGCDYFGAKAKAEAGGVQPQYPQFDWSANVNGTGGEVTGGGFGVQVKAAEQLEKGNERRLTDEFRKAHNAERTTQNVNTHGQARTDTDILPGGSASRGVAGETPALPGEACPAGTVCPYANAAPFYDDQGGRSRPPDTAAWYNGFM